MPKDWYNYYKQKAIQDASLFEENDNIDIGKEYDRIYKKYKEVFSMVDLNFEKITYEAVLGLTPEIDIDLKKYQKDFTKQKLKNFAKKYKEVNEILDWYLHDEITAAELSLLIGDFKKRNISYLKNYG